MNYLPELQISKYPQLNTLVIRKHDESKFFLASPNTLIIQIPKLAFLLKFLVESEYLSPKVLEGILEEYYSNRR